MGGKWPSTCTCCGQNICELDLDSSGGDEGYCADFTVTPSDVGTTLRFTFNPFTQEDRMVVGRNPVAACISGNHAANIANMAATVIDTGCVGASNPVSNPYDYTIQAGDTTIRVVVEPNCLGGSGTAWTISVDCIE